MLSRAHPGRRTDLAQLDPMILSAMNSVLTQAAVTHGLCMRNSLLDSHDGHDSTRALF
jgi:hypothetical protein